jgi:hypothetical protein
MAKYMGWKINLRNPRVASAGHALPIGNLLTSFRGAREREPGISKQLSGFRVWCWRTIPE